MPATLSAAMPCAPDAAPAPVPAALAAPRCPELVCLAGSLPALRAAVDHGADSVYLGLRHATHARNVAGLHFDDAAIATGIRYAHDRGVHVFVALDTYPQASHPQPWRQAVDQAVGMGADAILLADPGLMQYAARTHPQLRLHLSRLGAPILNDAFYPVALPCKGDDFSAPLQLLARSIAFDDPLTGQPRSFDSQFSLDWP